MQTWAHEVGLTQGYMDVLTDASLKQEITPEHSNLGQIAWHLTTFPKLLLSQAGLQFEGPSDDVERPTSAKEISDAYRRVSAAVTEAVKSQWSDAQLGETKTFFGRPFPIGIALTLLIHHQIHHRGQMNVLMRQAGLVVPSLYGPTKEQWIQIQSQTTLGI
jgi:uncharacterized damage-inducible protein DinB